MKQQIKKWALRLTATALLIGGILLLIILNPILTYAGKTTHNTFNIYHNKPIDAALLSRLDEATELLKTSEYFNPKLHIDICLNDGSKYPQLIRTLRGQAFAWGFYNKVVLQGTANFEENYIELNGYKWNLTQLLAHEMMHCLQYNQLGFWKSKPVASIPNWKWEGYAEYISRHGADQQQLTQNIARLQVTNKDEWAITFPDGTISPREYYIYWCLVKYSMDVKGMSYKQLLADTSNEKSIRAQMENWYLKSIIATSNSTGHVTNQKLKITPLTGDFFIFTTYNEYKGNQIPSNGMYLVTNAGVILFDTPWDTTQFQPLLDSIKNRHNKKVVLCIATHFHDDKTAGLEYYKAQGIKTFTTKATDELSKARGKKRAEFLMNKDTVFNIDSYSFQTYYPGAGHTSDNIIVWFGKEKILYGGCLVKSMDDDNLGNLADASTKDYATTIKNVMQKCKSPKFVIVGHGDWTNTASVEHTLMMAKKLRK